MSKSTTTRIDEIDTDTHQHGTEERGRGPRRRSPRAAKALVLALLALASLVSTTAAASAQNIPSEDHPQLYCANAAAIAHPAAQANRGGSPGWVWSYFAVQDQRSGAVLYSNWVISWGGQGHQPSYHLENGRWVQIGHGGLTFRVPQGSTQRLWEMRYTQSGVMATSNNWTNRWVQGGTCTAAVQRPW